MARATQVAIVRRKSKVVFFVIIKVVATSTAHTAIEKPDAAINRKCHIVLVTFPVCPCLIDHTDWMVGHILPSQPFFISGFVFSWYHDGFVIVTAEAGIRLDIDTADGFCMLLKRCKLIILQMSPGRKLPM